MSPIEIHWSTYKEQLRGEGQCLEIPIDTNERYEKFCVNNDNHTDKTVKDQDCIIRNEYVNFIKSKDKYKICFGNYTGYFDYYDESRKNKRVLVIHKKIQKSANLCDKCNTTSKPCENGTATFRCDNIARNYDALFEKFANEIINGLYLPFTIVSPTASDVRESVIEEHPLFVLLLMLSKKDEIIGAIHHILARPHRVLVDVKSPKRFDEVNYVDGDTLIEIVCSPQYWREFSGGCIKGRYAPLEVSQYTAEETFDTLENRFVKLILRIFMRAIDKCVKYIDENENKDDKIAAEGMENKKKELIHLKNEIEQALSGWIFSGVGNLNANPSNSQVLAKQPGYKELLNIWRLLGMSYIPSFITSLEMAFELKRMDLLWEYYVFSKIIGEFKKMKYKCEIKLESGNKQGEIEKYVERDSINLNFSNGKQNVGLLYQPKIKVKAVGRDTLTLIPDFLVESGKRFAIDAKFMLKENVPTGDLSKYLTIDRDGRDTPKEQEGTAATNGHDKVANAVIAACLKRPSKKQNGPKGKVLSFTHMFNDKKNKEINSLKEVLELGCGKISDIEIDKNNQLIGYVEIELPKIRG